MHRIKENGRWSLGQVFRNIDDLYFIEGMGEINGDQLVTKAKLIEDDSTLCKKVMSLYDVPSIMQENSGFSKFVDVFEHDILGVEVREDEWMYGEIKKTTGEHLEEKWIVDCTECCGEVFDLSKFVNDYTIDYHLGNSFDSPGLDSFNEFARKKLQY